MAKKILLIEDDPFLVDIYTAKLEHSGFEVETAVDGEQALKRAGGEATDAVFLDLVLPKVDGWEILKKLRENEKFKETPIFILSNLGQPEDLEKAKSMGADKYFVKANHKPSEIVDEIMKIL